jgi:hypothetical protein
LFHIASFPGLVDEPHQLFALYPFFLITCQVWMEQPG